MQRAPADFEEYVYASYGRLARLAYLLTADVSDAEDLLHDTLIAVERRWGLIEADGRYSYIRTALVNRSRRRARLRYRLETPMAAVPDHSRTSSSLLQVEDSGQIAFALRSLPLGQRTVVVLRYCEDLSEQQVAALLHCSVGTVKSQSAKALHKLRSHPAIETYRNTKETQEQ